MMRNSPGSSAAYIQTSDGFLHVKMDASILYCIEDPVKLVNMVGAGKLYEDNGIPAHRRERIKVRLGTLQPGGLLRCQNPGRQAR